MTAVADVMDLIPSWHRHADVSVAAVQKGSRSGCGEDEAVAVPVAASGPVRRDVGVTREVLAGAGFDGEVGQVRTDVAMGGGLLVLYGVGELAEVDADVLRDAAAAAALAAGRHGRLALVLPEGIGTAPDAAAQALVEGALLARYRWDVLK